MTVATICSHGTVRCWDVALVESQSAFDWWVHGERLLPAVIAFAAAYFFNRLSRRREKRKLSLETYGEFFSEEVASNRYRAETFFERHADVDWSSRDPYDVPDPDGHRVGYAAVTRYWARLSILFEENELDRRLTSKVLGRLMGYWWGLAYEEMTRRSNMYTARDIDRLFNAVRNGRSGGRQFQLGYESGLRRRRDSADRLKASVPASP